MPSRCWVAQQDEYGHEIDWRQPMTATHLMEGTPAVALSQYPADPREGTAAGTSSSRPSSRGYSEHGQEAPTIQLRMRTLEGREQQYVDEFLRLTIDDAEDLINALQYHTRTAEHRPA